jgi:hypothetical protein
MERRRGRGKNRQSLWVCVKGDRENAKVRVSCTEKRYEREREREREKRERRD